MRAVVQRVTRARVLVLEEAPARVAGEIERGLVVLLGVSVDDGERDAAWVAEKTAHLRCFDDDAGKMNLSVTDVGGAVLVISQFTLQGDARRGRRPDFTRAARPEVAAPLYDLYCERLAAQGVLVARGVFRAAMQVELVNDGPVTLLLDSKESKEGRTT